MKDISSFIVLHYNFAALFVKQDIFETSSSKESPKEAKILLFPHRYDLFEK